MKHSDDDDEQIRESNKIQDGIIRLVGAGVVGCVCGWITSFFVDGAAIRAATFGSGLATYYLWSGVNK
jgi:hypothetical protein